MNQMQFSAPQITKTNKIILITAGVCFLLAQILRSIGAFSLPAILGLSGSGFFQGLIFQLVTYPLVEVHLMSFIFSSLIIWFIGSELEGNWGSKVYLRFLLLTVISVGLIYALVNLIFLFGTRYYFNPLHGLSGITFALLIAYSMLYPHRQLSFMMIFPMQARTFCWILVGIEAYMAIFSQLSSAWAHLLAMGISFLLVRFQNQPLVRKVLHFSFPSRPKKKQSKNHLYVVKDDDDTPPKYWQ
jgi:membrane associated rhomboid family serine protease